MILSHNISLEKLNFIYSEKASKILRIHEVWTLKLNHSAKRTQNKTGKNTTATTLQGSLSTRTVLYSIDTKLNGNLE